MEKNIDHFLAQIKRETDYFNKAKLILFLRKERQIPLKILAEKLNLKSSYLCQLLRLNRIPEIITDGYYSHFISITHLFVLARVKDQNKMLQAYERILANNLTVAQAENLVCEVLYGIKPEGGYLSSDEKNQIASKLRKGQKEILVKITQTRIKSKLVVEIKGDLAKTGNLLKDLFL